MTDAEMALIKEDGDKIFEAAKLEITDDEAMALGRAMFASVVTNDNCVAIAGIRDHKRVIAISSLYGDHNFSFKIARGIPSARAVEDKLIKSGVKLNLVGS
jgi:hypothetical protein